MTTNCCRIGGMARRDVLRAGFGSLAIGAAGLWPRAGLGANAANAAPARERILVVLELSGGNDGLNTVVPYGDDAYYRARPRIGIKPARLRKLDDHFGLQYTMAGLERLYKDGRMAIVHGVGYEQPRSRTFLPWPIGRPRRPTAAISTAGSAGWPMPWSGGAQQLHRQYRHPAVAGGALARPRAAGVRRPEKFVRTGFADEKDVLATISTRDHGTNEAEDFMYGVSRSALNAEQLVRDAWAQYRTPVDYGLVRFGLDRVAALIAAGFPTRSITSPTATTPSIPTSTKKTCMRGCGPTPPTTSPAS